MSLDPQLWFHGNNRLTSKTGVNSNRIDSVFPHPSLSKKMWNYSSWSLYQYTVFLLMALAEILWRTMEQIKKHSIKQQAILYFTLNVWRKKWSCGGKLQSWWLIYQRLIATANILNCKIEKAIAWKVKILLHQVAIAKQQWTKRPNSFGGLCLCTERKWKNKDWIMPFARVQYFHSEDCLNSIYRSPLQAFSKSSSRGFIGMLRAWWVWLISSAHL